MVKTNKTTTTKATKATKNTKNESRQDLIKLATKAGIDSDIIAQFELNEISSKDFKSIIDKMQKLESKKVVDKAKKDSKPELKNLLGGALKKRNLTTAKVISDIESKKAIKVNCLDKKGNILSTVLVRTANMRFDDKDVPSNIKFDGRKCIVLDDNGFLCIDAYIKGDIQKTALYINSVYVPSDTVELKTA